MESDEKMIVHHVFNRTIKMNDGTILKGTGNVNPNTDNFWLWIDPGETMIHIVEIFSDPSKTESISVYSVSDEHTIYEGYTTLWSVSTDNTGTISVCMKR